VEAQELAALFAACSNAGRWGPDDELGTLNLITPATRRRAARLVTEGLSVSMASDLSVQHTPSTDSLTSHTAFTDPAAPIAVADAITLQVHGWSTHLDALGHIYTDGVGYNGRRRAEIFTGQGLAANAIIAMKDGVFTRGVLLDVAARGGVPWLQADHAITRAELERAEDAAVLAQVNHRRRAHAAVGDAELRLELEARQVSGPVIDPDVVILVDAEPDDAADLPLVRQRFRPRGIEQVARRVLPLRTHAHEQPHRTDSHDKGNDSFHAARSYATFACRLDQPRFRAWMSA